MRSLPTKRPLLLFWLLPLLLTACIPRGIRVPQSPYLRNLERKSGLIAYIGTDGNIYTINQGGGNQTAITDDAEFPGQYLFPTWRPNSQELAFVGVENSEDDTPAQVKIYLAAADGSDMREIYHSNSRVPFYLYWSPDGNTLTFLASTLFGGHMTLEMVTADGEESQILDTGEPYYWTWAPDGNQMFIHAGGTTAESRLSFLHLSDPVIEQVTTFRPSFFQAPAWSPDGQQLLIATKTDAEENTLLLVDQQGNEVRVVKTLESSAGIAFAWSPDGQKIAYIVSERARTQGVLGPLTVVDTTNSENVITPEEDQVVAFFWSPDSQKLAYIVPVRAPVDESDSPQQPILLLALYVLDVTSGESEVVAVFQPTQEFVSILPFFDQYQHSTTIWSPDSNNLVLTAFTGDETPDVWVVAASGRLEPRVIAEGVLAFWSWK